MEGFDKIDDWVNWENIDYDIFLCYTYDILDGFVDDRFRYNTIGDLQYPIIAKNIKCFYKWFNSRQPFFLENGEQAKVYNMEEYWEDYSIGVIHGLNSFDKQLQKESSILSNIDYIKQILRSRLKEPFRFNLSSLSTEKDGRKVLKKQTFYDAGKECGEIYSCWTRVIKGNQIFVDLIREVYKDQLEYYRHHHTNNDFGNINSFPIGSIDKESKKDLSFKDLIWDDCVSNGKFEAFIEELKKDEPTISKAVLKQDGSWNHTGIMSLSLWIIADKLNLFRKGVFKKDIKRAISNTFKVEYGAIERKTFKDLSNHIEYSYIEEIIQEAAEKFLK